jgi:hypothetical protein
MAEQHATTISGRKLMGWLFMLGVGIAVGLGGVLGWIIPQSVNGSIGIFFIQFTPTPMNMAAFGVLFVLLTAVCVYSVLSTIAE